MADRPWLEVRDRRLRAIGPHVRVEELDVTSDSDVNAVAERIEREAGRFDVLVNNAGRLYGGVTEALTVEQFAAQFETNAIGLFRVMRAILPLMRRRRSGLIVNFSSIAGRLAFPFFGAYCASKWAVDALTESMRYELSTLGIVAVEPGFFTRSSSHTRRGRQTPRGQTNTGQHRRFPSSSLKRSIVSSRVSLLKQSRTSS